MTIAPEFETRYAVDPSSAVPGRTGSTLRATERATGRRVAVKVLERGAPQRDGLSDQQLLSDLRRSCDVDHPNLVRVRDVLLGAEGLIYVVSDFVEGDSLRERGAGRGRMEVNDALAAAQGILHGLAYLHAKGLIHGNLKMENVALTDHGRPVILDHALAPVRRGGALPSNPANVAPELLTPGAKPTPASDLYAVGTIFYELLTGNPPFPGTDVMDVLHGHLEVHAIPPSGRVEDIPTEADAVVEKSLRKDPARRYATADEMLKAIGVAMAKLPRPAALPGGKLNVLLIFLPLALAAHTLHWSEVSIFFFSCLAIVPMASILGEATEHLAEQVGPALGGFLNASFGNATEILISLFGIYKGGQMVDTVKASLTGSILGNLLFIMGMAMFLGGLKREKQLFNRTATGVGNSLMILAVAGLLIPSIVHAIYRADPKLADLDAVTTQRLSLTVSGILLVTYFLSLLFSLKTHRHLSAAVPEVDPSEHGEHTQLMSRKKAVMLLAGATLCISIMSEMLVSSVEKTGEILNINPLFMGMVVIAMVGNAAEHATAVVVGIKDKMDLACSIAMGSSVQVALFLAPFLVVVSHLIGKPIDLVFSPMEVVAVMLAVGVTISVNIDGESTWIEGALLLAVYAILAAAFWFMPYDPHHQDSKPPPQQHGRLYRTGRDPLYLPSTSS